MPTDPACYMTVDEDTPYTTVYKGETFYFCTDFCRRKFDENPGKYAKLAFAIVVDTTRPGC